MTVNVIAEPRPAPADEAQLHLRIWLAGTPFDYAATASAVDALIHDWMRARWCTSNWYAARYRTCGCCRACHVNDCSARRDRSALRNSLEMRAATLSWPVSGDDSARGWLRWMPSLFQGCASPLVIERAASRLIGSEVA